MRAARGELALAESGFRAALQCAGGAAEAWLDLARVLARANRAEEALSAAQEALAGQPDDTAALELVGRLLRDARRLDQAVAIDQRLVALEPENVAALHRLGQSLRDLRRYAEAERAWRNALAFDPARPEVEADLALLLVTTGRANDAIAPLFRSVAAFPAAASLRTALAESLNGVQLGETSAADRATLADLCLDERVWTPLLTPTILGLIDDHPGFELLRARLAAAQDPFVPSAPSIAAFLDDPLFRIALARMVVTDFPIESVLAYVRDFVLRHVPASPPWSDGVAIPLPFVCALARQCFLTSYVLRATDDELERLAALRESLEHALATGDASRATLERPLAAFALYAPLGALAGSGRLLDADAGTWSDAFRPLVAEQLANPESEREIAARLPSVTAIDDGVSVSVRGQYEENPYPRWVSVNSPRAETFDALFRRLHGGAPAPALPGPVPILVAGCGTGRHSIQVARTLPDGEILAVDLSRASLAYAARMTAGLGITNVTYVHGDILNLGALTRRFAVIECCGVLHHLADPMAGWRVLRELLEPYGLMRIALYSERGRAPVLAAREYLRSLGLPANAEGIRASRHAIAALPAEHPARGIMRFVDFYAQDEFRDLALHVQEHRFTLPHIARCLQALDLRLLQLECAPATRTRFAAAFPDRDPATDLDAWDRFEEANPDTFRNMYLFWCCPGGYVPDTAASARGATAGMAITPPPRHTSPS